ncbi:MAG: 2OG-Fe(II) oxygenase [Pseudomonadota bacterium]
MPGHIKTFKNALPAALCREAISLFEKDSRVKPDPQPDYSKRHFLKLTGTPGWQDIERRMQKHMDAVTQSYFAPIRGLEEIAIPEWSDDGLVMSRYNPGDICALHVDGQTAAPSGNGLRLATLLFFLNTVEKGGETWFPFQKTKVKPELGTAVMFPVSFTHPHEVLKTYEKRYIIQTWIIDPYLVVEPRS